MRVPFWLLADIGEVALNTSDNALNEYTPLSRLKQLASITAPIQTAPVTAQAPHFRPFVNRRGRKPPLSPRARAGVCPCAPRMSAPCPAHSTPSSAGHTATPRPSAPAHRAGRSQASVHAVPTSVAGNAQCPSPRPQDSIATVQEQTANTTPTAEGWTAGPGAGSAVAVECGPCPTGRGPG